MSRFMEGRLNMRRFVFQHYPVSLMIQDAIILLTPVILVLIGFLILE